MPNQITLNVNSTGPGFLLLSEVWYPGWKAYANGKEVAVIKSDDIFRSIFVNKGNTNIEFIYKPFSYELGKGLTLATLILLLLYLVLKYKIFILKWIK